MQIISAQQPFQITELLIVQVNHSFEPVAEMSLTFLQNLF
jgi:hypothetical protein